MKLKFLYITFLLSFSFLIIIFNKNALETSKDTSNLKVNQINEDLKSIYQLNKELEENLKDLDLQTSSVKQDINWVFENVLANTEGNSVVSRGYFNHGNYLNLDLRKRTGYTQSQLKVLTNGTNLQGIEEYAVIAENLYSVNSIFIISLAQHESNFGRSNLSKHKNNLFGLGAYDSSPYESGFYFKKKGDCVIYFSKLMQSRYFLSGDINLVSVGKKYASDVMWPYKVASIMKENENKILENKK